MERLAEIHREQASLMRQLEQLKHEEMEVQARMAEQQGSQQAANVQSALQDQPAAPSLHAAVALHVEMQQTAPAISSFLDLPDELSILVWRAILAMDVCSAMRLCQANKSLCSNLEPVKAEAKAYWLRWGALKPLGIPAGDGSVQEVAFMALTKGRSPQRQSLAGGAW